LKRKFGGNSGDVSLQNCLQWVWHYWGRSNTHQHWFAIWLRFGQKLFNLAFCSYLHFRFFNWAAFPGGRISNSPTSQSPIVSGYHMNSFSIKNIKPVLYLLLVFFVFIIGVGIYNYITHPLSNKGIISYVTSNLDEHKQEYTSLIKYIDTIQVESKAFNIEVSKSKPSLYTLDLNRGYSNDPDKLVLQSNFVFPGEIKQLFSALGIRNLMFRYKNDAPCLIIYKDILNHSLTGKKVHLYYFPNSYRKDFFGSDYEVETLYNNARIESEKNWLYQVDSNWVISSRDRDNR
jgi:hypothetical protein